MQTVQKRARLKFNFFDIMVLIFVTLIVVSSVYLSVMTEKDPSANTADGFEYVLVSEKMNDAFVALLSVGDSIYETESDRKIGVITDIKITDSVALSGEGLYSQTYEILEGFSNVEITVDCSGAFFEDSEGIMNLAVNGYTVRLGTDISVRNSKVMFTAECHLPVKAGDEK